MKLARFVAAARSEYLAEIAYYAKIDAALGARFATAVEEAAARGVSFPLTGSPAARGTRRVFVKDFPFTIVYRQMEDGIVVFAVAHHSRRPSYWRSRVQATDQRPGS